MKLIKSLLIATFALTTVNAFAAPSDEATQPPADAVVVTTQEAAADATASTEAATEAADDATAAAADATAAAEEAVDSARVK